jgi:mTERF domain-containing protein
MFKLALRAVAFQNEEKIAAKVECLKNTFRWSDDNVGIAVSKAPVVLRVPKHELQRRSDFLFSEVGLEPMYIAHRPIMLCLSLEGRLRPRYYLVKFLKENGLLDRKWSYNSIILLSEKRFVEKFICPHQEAAPHLIEDYAAACAGEVPARLIFASTDQPRT